MNLKRLLIDYQNSRLRIPGMSPGANGSEGWNGYYLGLVFQVPRV